jgi:hypothetical protein
MLITLLLSIISSFASSHSVSDIDELRRAVASAEPGDDIVVEAGRYVLSTPLDLSQSGTSEAPIQLRGAAAGEVWLYVDQPEGVRLSGAYWTLSDLAFNGQCDTDSACEHALHLYGDADHTAIQNSIFANFNAHIKSNGMNGDFPDAVLIEGSTFYNDAPRDTSNPVTPLDIVGGSSWVVRGNHIYDFAKAGGNQVSYAAFFKGNSKDGLFENNLIECEAKHTGYVRLGLSLGGGGTSPDSVCEESDCSTEHTGGQLINNIIVNCPADVGIYLNKAKDTQVLHNLLYQTAGIDARFSNTTALVDGNVMDGKLRERDGATTTTGINLIDYTAFDDAFMDPSQNDFRTQNLEDLRDSGNPEVLFDFCWNERSETTTLGAIESDCDTSRAYAKSTVTEDGSVSPDDSTPVDDGAAIPATGCMTVGAAPLASYLLALPALCFRRRRAVAVVVSSSVALSACSEYGIHGQLNAFEAPVVEEDSPLGPEATVDPCKSELHTVRFEVEFPESEGCLWDQDDNLSPVDKLVRARSIDEVRLLREEDVVCDLQFEFSTEQGGIDFDLRYDDQLMLALNERVIFISNERLLDQLGRDSEDRLLANWDSIKDLEMPFYSAPWAIGNATNIVLPNHDVAGAAHLEVDGVALSELSGLAREEARLDLQLWAFGDNDESDCGQSGISFWVDVTMPVSVDFDQ